MSIALPNKLTGLHDSLFENTEGQKQAGQLVFVCSLLNVHLILGVSK